MFTVCYIFSDATLAGCYAHETEGIYLWTAGQRIDPSWESAFVWRVTYINGCSDIVTPMNYTNWNETQPNNYPEFVPQSCMNLWAGFAYT